MPKVKDAEERSFEECIEDCYYSSKFCYNKADGTPVCPIDYRKCADDCRKQHTSHA